MEPSHVPGLVGGTMTTLTSHEQRSGTITKPMRIKLVFITFHLNVGGAERQLYYLIRGLDKAKYSIHVVTLWPGDTLRPQIEATGATVVPIHKKWKFDVTVLFRLRRFLRELRPDIVQCQLYTANMWGRVAAVMARCENIIVSERNADELWKTRIHFAMERLLNGYATAYLGNSRRVCSYCEEKLGLPEGTYRLMHNGVDTTEFRPLSSEARIGHTGPVIGTVANLHVRKDLVTFLRMAARVLDQFPQATFRIVGSGPEKHSLLQLANRLGISSRVEFAGATSNVKDAYLTFDVFVLSSHNEGFANAIVEAMASGLPVIATDVGGAREAIEEGRTGYVVPTHNPEALVEHVARLLTDPDLRSKMGRAGRERAVHLFSLEALVRRYDSFYSGLIRSQHLSHRSTPPHHAKTTYVDAGITDRG
jgi:glycosyltransferase involved in cell wall biosynthesis